MRELLFVCLFVFITLASACFLIDIHLLFGRDIGGGGGEDIAGEMEGGDGAE